MPEENIDACVSVIKLLMLSWLTCFKIEQLRYHTVSIEKSSLPKKTTVVQLQPVPCPTGNAHRLPLGPNISPAEAAKIQQLKQNRREVFTFFEMGIGQNLVPL